MNRLDTTVPRKLEVIIKINGFVYKQLERSPSYAIYVQLNSLESDQIRGYEVIKIQIWKGDKLKGKYYPSKEKFPKISKWGTQGWTYSRIEDALEKYNSLIGHEKKTEQQLSTQIQKKAA